MLDVSEVPMGVARCGHHRHTEQRRRQREIQALRRELEQPMSDQAFWMLEARYERLAVAYERDYREVCP